jgi:AraC family transcriptional regulator
MHQHSQFPLNNLIASEDPDPARRHVELARGIVEAYEHCVTAHTGILETDESSELTPSKRTGRLSQILDGTKGIETLWNAVISENGNGRLVSTLSRALEAVEQQDDKSCADNLRLAIAIRLLGFQSGCTPPAQAEQVGPWREIRALQKWRLKRVMQYIESRLSARITLADMAAVAGLSRMHFASQFRAATGLRPHEFLLRRRVRRAEELLKNTAMPIAEIALAVGFQTQAHLTTVFKRFVGCTPGRWRAIRQTSIIPFTASRPAESVDAFVD